MTGFWFGFFCGFVAAITLVIVGGFLIMPKEDKWAILHKSEIEK